MKMTLTIIFTLFFTLLSAPPSTSVVIFASEGICPYGRIIYAIGMAESRLDTLAYNPDEQATGFFQCRPIRLKDFNERTGNNFTMRDMYDYKKAEKIFLFYATQFRYDDYRGISYEWNKSVTERYWLKVQRHL